MASINKFAVAPMNPIFDYPGISGVSLSNYLPETEAVEGYTGASIVTEPKTKEVTAVRTSYGSEIVPKGETIILAGQGYGTGGYPKESLASLIKQESVITGIPEADIKEYVIRTTPDIAAGTERALLGRPVYSIPAQKEYIPGGYADGCTDDEFDPMQIQKGIEVEKEHVIKFTDKGRVKKFKDTDLAKAKEIAKDHLAEIPDYYDRLEDMEEESKRDGVYIDVVEKKASG